MECCAVKEINGIAYHAPEESLRCIYEEMVASLPCAFFIFTARAEKEYTYGIKFKECILANGLGNVIESNAIHNPRYANDATHDIIVYIWELNRKAFDEWYNKNFPKPVVPN